MPAKKAPAATADSTLALLANIVRALDEKKAVDLRALRVSAQSTITDYLVLATGTSDPHLRAFRVELEKVIDAAHAPIAGMESSEGSGWTVVDAYQIMVHLFTPEKREEYRLERLWQDAEDLPVADLLAKKAVKPRAPRKTAAKPKAPAKAKTAAKPRAAGAVKKTTRKRTAG
jgi:ribosome-associated protein